MLVSEQPSAPLAAAGRLPPPSIEPTDHAWAQPTPGRIAYGGFWIRVLAYFVDAILLLIASVVLRLILGTLGAFVGVFVGWLYFALMESSASQATIGKNVCGLRVTDESGHRISFGRATGRYFAKILSALIFLIGFMMVGWTRRKQGLHDLIASTVVLRVS
jgi:uncharacterized RDD family membrane protein YckC